MPFIWIHKNLSLVSPLYRAESYLSSSATIDVQIEKESVQTILKSSIVCCSDERVRQCLSSNDLVYLGIHCEIFSMVWNKQLMEVEKKPMNNNNSSYNEKRSTHSRKQTRVDRKYMTAHASGTYKTNTDCRLVFSVCWVRPMYVEWKELSYHNCTSVVAAGTAGTTRSEIVEWDRFSLHCWDWVSLW